MTARRLAQFASSSLIQPLLTPPKPLAAAASSAEAQLILYPTAQLSFADFGSFDGGNAPPKQGAGEPVSLAGHPALLRSHSRHPPTLQIARRGSNILAKF